jgi:hypothetical protein
MQFFRPMVPAFFIRRLRPPKVQAFSGTLYATNALGCRCTLVASNNQQKAIFRGLLVSRPVQTPLVKSRPVTTIDEHSVFKDFAGDFR